MKPLQRPDSPDFSKFLKVIKRQGGRDYVPFFEMCPSHFEALSGLTPQCTLNFCPDSPTFEASFSYYFQAMAAMGFDHGTINVCGYNGLAPMARGSEDGVIRNDADFDAYHWPSVANVDTDTMELTARQAPDGMGVMTGCGCVFQALFDCFGYTNLCYALFENRDLVRRIVDQAGSTILEIADVCTQMPFIQGFLLSGDMGYKTGPMISPADLNEFIFPWHKRIVDAIHRNGKIALRHSCGNLAEFYEDFIAIGYDAKHSFEDAITPGIQELHDLYGSRLCFLGGIDVDFLCRADETAIRKRVRDTIDAFAPNGGWMLGTGNSVPDWMPPEKFWALLDEGLHYGR